LQYSDPTSCRLYAAAPSIVLPIMCPSEEWVAVKLPKVTRLNVFRGGSPKFTFEDDGRAFVKEYTKVGFCMRWPSLTKSVADKPLQARR
jgi:hypothetical protein